MSSDARDGVGDYRPADAFGAISNEIRVEILHEFIEEMRRQSHAHDEAIPPETLQPVLSFSELQEAVGVEDSGQFSYHLDQLVGRYVQQIEDGYTITWAGIEVAGSILAGGYGDVAIDRQEIDRTCPSCGSGLEADYTMGLFFLFCTGSEDVVLAAGVPAGVFEGRTLEEAADVAIAVQLHLQEAIMDGYCPVCYGSVDMRLGRSTTEDVLVDGEYGLRGQCDRCANVFMGSIKALAVRHPAVVAFYHDHGIDVRERFHDSFAPFGEDETLDVVSEDPPRVAATFEVEDHAIRAVVDESGDVIETERL
jgi:hypothetical protein